MITLDVDYLKYSQIADESVNFLNQNNADSIPIEIEHIIEYNYGIDIIPLPGLLDLYGVDGFITHDFSSIYVDNFIYEHRKYRYRYTLAHEIGHLFLHKKYLDVYQFSNINEWKNFYNEMDQRDYAIMEFQGYAFGGLVLVPQLELKKYFTEYLPQVIPLIEQAQSKGVDRKNYSIYAKDALASYLSPIFEASTDVLNKRIDYDLLDVLIP